MVPRLSLPSLSGLLTEMIELMAKCRVSKPVLLGAAARECCSGCVPTSCRPACSVTAGILRGSARLCRTGDSGEGAAAHSEDVSAFNFSHRSSAFTIGELLMAPGEQPPDTDFVRGLNAFREARRRVVAELACEGDMSAFQFDYALTAPVTRPADHVRVRVAAAEPPPTAPGLLSSPPDEEGAAAAAAAGARHQQLQRDAEPTPAASAAAAVAASTTAAATLAVTAAVPTAPTAAAAAAAGGLRADRIYVPLAHGGALHRRRSSSSHSADAENGHPQQQQQQEPQQQPPQPERAVAAGEDSRPTEQLERTVPTAAQDGGVRLEGTVDVEALPPPPHIAHCSYSSSSLLAHGAAPSAQISPEAPSAQISPEMEQQILSRVARTCMPMMWRSQSLPPARRRSAHRRSLTALTVGVAAEAIAHPTATSQRE